MLRRLLYACTLAALVLAGSAGSALAMPPGPKHPPDKGAQFQVVLNPNGNGFTSANTFLIFPVTFKDYLYTFVSDVTGLQVIRSRDGKKWELTSMPMPSNALYNSVGDMFVYQDKLYIALNQDRCTDPTITTPGLILRTGNGKDWEKVFEIPSVSGLTDEGGTFGEYKGMLYFFSVVGFGQSGTAQLWRSRSGNPGSWALATPAFGNNTDHTTQFTTFKDAAYVSSHDQNGMHVWRTNDGSNWQTVGESVLNVNNTSVTNWMGSNLVVFQDNLYIGTNAWQFLFSWFYSGYDPANYKGGNIYRTKDGVKWDAVLTNGFAGTANHSGAETLAVYKGQIYAMTNDMSPDWTNGTLYVWSSRSGKAGDWLKVNNGGLGPNTGLIAANWAIFKDNLYIGNDWGVGPGIWLDKMVNP